MKTIKYIALFVLTAATLGLGACAQSSQNAKPAPAVMSK